jgi:hypothetical protein
MQSAKLQSCLMIGCLEAPSGAVQSFQRRRQGVPRFRRLIYSPEGEKKSLESWRQQIRLLHVGSAGNIAWLLCRGKICYTIQF